jgi:hypothetical protein
VLRYDSSIVLENIVKTVQGQCSKGQISKAKLERPALAESQNEDQFTCNTQRNTYREQWPEQILKFWFEIRY